jgi:beta-aspartyl-peptidase (threonine type)
MGCGVGVGSATERLNIAEREEGEAMFAMIKRRLIAVVTLTVVWPCSGAATGQSATESPSVKQVKAVLDRQVEAWNRGDLEAFMNGYWQSNELTFYSNSVRTSGWSETLDRYRNRYQKGGNQMGRLEFLELKIEILGARAAFVRGRYQLNGGESTGPFTLILKKLKGDWKIIHDHTSTGQ